MSRKTLLFSSPYVGAVDGLECRCAGPGAHGPAATSPGQGPVLHVTAPGKGTGVFSGALWTAKTRRPRHFWHLKRPGRTQRAARQVVTGGRKEGRRGMKRRKVCCCCLSPPRGRTEQEEGWAGTRAHPTRPTPWLTPGLATQGGPQHPPLVEARARFCCSAFGRSRARLFPSVGNFS